MLFSLPMIAATKYKPIFAVPALQSSPMTVNLVVLRTKRPDGLSSPPDLEVPDLLQLGLELLTVVGVRVVLERAGSLFSSLDRVIEFVKEWLESVLELVGPVDGTTAGGSRTCSIHPIHTVLLRSI